jgi:hypothetical protein
MMALGLMSGTHEEQEPATEEEQHWEEPMTEEEHWVSKTMEEEEEEDNDDCIVWGPGRIDCADAVVCSLMVPL